MVLVVCPLNSLINDQIQKILTTGLRVSVLNVNKNDETSTSTGDEEVFCDVGELGKREKLLTGYYNLLFAHPEALLSSNFGRDLVNNIVYQKHVCVVIDEAHCIIEWYVYE